MGITAIVLPIAARACGSDLIGTGTIAGIVDARTLRLENGRELRLAAVEVPAEAETDSVRVQATHMARAALTRLTMGQPVELRRLGPDEDRYGRIVAHVTITAGPEPKPLQESLVAEGVALTAGRIEDRACATRLLTLEQAARDAKLGLWGDPYYVLRRAENTVGLRADIGRFSVVEGKVLSVRESGGTLYLNFGRRWTRDFAVTIAKRQERQFAAVGIEPGKLEGRNIRVRGWIEDRGGPRLEAARPEQIEIIGR